MNENQSSIVFPSGQLRGWVTCSECIHAEYSPAEYITLDPKNPKSRHYLDTRFPTSDFRDYVIYFCRKFDYYPSLGGCILGAD